MNLITEIEIGYLVTAAGVLVIVTNALTELFKAMFPKAPAQITATLISLVLTVCTVFTFLAIVGINPEWYMVTGSIIAGFFISYMAQFGYDKLKEILKLIGGRK